nr:unnamed protein product [Spirometra erinaceieuropaei]
MGLFGHIRIPESGLDRTPDTPTTSNTSTVHTPTLVPSVRATTAAAAAASIIITIITPRELTKGWSTDASTSAWWT